MDEQDKVKQDIEQPKASAPPQEEIKPSDPKVASPATAQQLTVVEQHMSSFERSTLRWARTAVILSGLAALFVCAQWWEMHQGGVDTHNLAAAAATQATQMTNLATAAGNQATWTERLAGSMGDQAGDTKTIAGQAVVQANTAKIAANAAESAADTASASLRPWIKVSGVDLRPGIGGIMTLMFHWPESGIQPFPQRAGKELPPTLQIKISTLNIGHSPAKGVEVIPELFFHKFSGNQWHNIVIEEERRFCDSVIHRDLSGAATIAFPSDPSETFMGISGLIRDADIDREPGSSNRYSSAALIVCVNYKGVQGISYQTQAWFGLYEDNRIQLPVGVDADADHLRLIRELNGDQAN